MVKDKKQLTEREKLIKQNLPQIVYHLSKTTQHLNNLDTSLTEELKEFQIKIINQFRKNE